MGNCQKRHKQSSANQKLREECFSTPKNKKIKVPNPYLSNMSNSTSSSLASSKCLSNGICQSTPAKNVSISSNQKGNLLKIVQEGKSNNAVDRYIQKLIK